MVPKSTNPERIKANLEDNFVLADEGIQKIDALVKSKGMGFNRPDWGTVIFHDDADCRLKRVIWHSRDKI